MLRERGHVWRSRPKPIMLVATAGDVGIVASLAMGGILMSALPVVATALLLLATLGFAFAMDWVKIAVFAHFRID